MTQRNTTQALAETEILDTAPNRRATHVLAEAEVLDSAPQRQVTWAMAEVEIGPVLGAWDDPVASPQAMIEIYWDDAWVDETDYLFLPGGLDVKRSMIDPLRGLASMGGAPLGTATAQLRNDDGRYSKTVAGSQAATYGLHGKPIRMSLSYGSNYETIFTGRIVDPQHTESGETCTLYCRDEGETLLGQTDSRQMNAGAQSSSMIATYATEGGLGVNDYDLDQGLFLIPFAYLEEDNLWHEIQRVAASEGGLIFIDRDGVLQFWNAAHWLDLSSVQTFDEALYGECVLRYDYENKYNVIAVNYEPRQETQNATVFTLRRPVVVPIDGTATETFQFRWPLAEFDSYDMTVVTGGGADLSASVSIDPSSPQNAQSWTVAFTNTSTIHAAYVTAFEVVGRVSEGRPSEVYTADPGSVAGTKAARKLNLSGNFYVQSPGQARLVGNLLSDRLATEVLTMRLTECPALPTLELGDKVTIEATNNDVNNEAVVVGLHFTFGPAAKMDVDCVDITNLYGDSGYFKVGTSALGTGKLFY